MADAREISRSELIEELLLAALNAKCGQGIV